MSHPAPLQSDTRSLSTLGGTMGIAACGIGLAIFLLGCTGFNAAFALAFLPLGLSLLGMIATIIGGVREPGGPEHTPVLAGIFLNLFGIVGGVLELAVHNDWMIFYRQSAL
jgi:hypothetical protein